MEQGKLRDRAAAWHALYEEGWTFADIARCFGVNHRTVTEAFERYELPERRGPRRGRWARLPLPR